MKTVSMKTLWSKILKLIGQFLLFLLLTILTQVGGLVYLLSLAVNKWVVSHFLTNKDKPIRCQKTLVFLSLYIVVTLLIIPLLAPVFGREKVRHTANIKPANYLTVLLNRNYVRPALNDVLARIEKDLAGTNIRLSYLDANFPFLKGFPLAPHFSHNDGKKIDLAYIYKDEQGEISTKQKSISGYGVFEPPKTHEKDQPKHCLSKVNAFYDYPKFFTLGSINSSLEFDKNANKKLLKAILKQKKVQKIFIEPHLKQRLRLYHAKIRYHGCKSVRHDDHIHMQIR